MWPRSGFPFLNNTKDTLLLELQAYMITEQSSINASSKGIIKTVIGEPIIFLMPLTFSTTINHEYDNASSIATPIAEGFTHAAGTGRELASGGTSVVTNKYDTPMTFKDAERRILNVTVGLQDQGNTKSDVFEPVRLLEVYSCPDKTPGIGDFDMPYIFRVRTVDSDLIYIENAALTSVQPTWYGPYRDGYPSKCELTLEFKDMEPLYRRVFPGSNKYNPYRKQSGSNRGFI
jgi:hypothetical protein